MIEVGILFGKPTRKTTATKSQIRLSRIATFGIGCRALTVRPDPVSSPRSVASHASVIEGLIQPAIMNSIIVLKVEGLNVITVHGKKVTGKAIEDDGGNHVRIVFSYFCRMSVGKLQRSLKLSPAEARMLSRISRIVICIRKN